MQLKTFLEDLQPTDSIRLGYESGSNFVYIGKKSGFRPTIVDSKIKQNRRQEIDNMLNTFFAERKDSDKAKKAIHDKVDEYTKYVPVLDREVVESLKSTVDNDLIICLKGEEKGWINYLPDLPPLTADTMYGKGANDILMAIHKPIVNELVGSYMNLYRAKVGTERYNRLLEIIESSKRTIRANHYGIFTDPEGIIDACKHSALQRVSEEDEKKRKKSKKKANIENGTDNG